MTAYKTICSIAVLTVALSACSSNDDITSEIALPGDSAPAGLLTNVSMLNVPEAIGALQTAFGNNDAISALPPIDHQANAQSVELTLRPTSVILFGNPGLGTPLMQANQQAGLDLPLKMLAFEDESGTTQLAYNAPSYLQQRHDLSGVDQQLATMTMALSNLAAVASGNADDTAATGQTTLISAGAVTANQGVIVVSSEQDMETTYNTLRDAIDTAAPLRLVAEVDHTANAESVGLQLLPTRLIIFGNPNLGTPLMQSSQSIGIDLPQKMLVFEDETGQVSIAYNDPAFLASRHGATEQDERLATISTALGNLAAGAAATP